MGVVDRDPEGEEVLAADDALGARAIQVARPIASSPELARCRATAGCRSERLHDPPFTHGAGSHASRLKLAAIRTKSLIFITACHSGSPICPWEEHLPRA